MNKKVILILLVVVLSVISVSCIIWGIQLQKNDSKDIKEEKTEKVKEEQKKEEKDYTEDIKSFVKKNLGDSWTYSDDKLIINDDYSIEVVLNNVEDWVSCAFLSEDYAIAFGSTNDSLLNVIKNVTFACKNNNQLNSKVLYEGISTLNSNNYSSKRKAYDSNGDLITKSFEDGFKELSNSYTYKDIFRNPDQYVGKKIKITGKVIQVMEDTVDGKDSWVLRVDMTKDKYGYYDDTVMIVLSKTAFNGRILEDDIITFYGMCADTYTYTTVLGAEETVPLIYGATATLVK